jgi:hypothetical protein
VFHKLRVISSVTEDLLASQEGLCSMELVSPFNEAVQIVDLQKCSIRSDRNVINIE